METTPLTTWAPWVQRYRSRGAAGQAIAGCASCAQWDARPVRKQMVKLTPSATLRMLATRVSCSAEPNAPRPEGPGGPDGPGEPWRGVPRAGHDPSVGTGSDEPRSWALRACDGPGGVGSGPFEA